MGDVFDIKTKRRTVVDLASHRRVGLAVGIEGWSEATCPYCKKVVALPPGYSPSFTCRVGKEHRHMKDDRDLLEVRR
jgi:hypothetical protein